MEYVNPPVGGGPQAARRRCAPHLAIPTTSGTGSRGDDRRRARHPRAARQDGHLAPLPAPGAGDRRPRAGAHAARAEVDASAGPRRRLPRGRVVPRRARTTARARPASPDERPPYQGANPVADVWSAKALEYGGRFLRRAVADPDDVEARGRDDARRDDGGRRLRLGRRAHPARVRVSDRRPASTTTGRPAIPDDHPFVPHGHSVIVTAPAAFRFTYEAAPERHEHVAALLAGAPGERARTRCPTCCAR